MAGINGRGQSHISELLDVKNVRITNLIDPDQTIWEPRMKAVEAKSMHRPTPAQDAAFDKAYKESGTLMCLCSRIASGRVVRSPGLKRKGFVASDNLQPWKARILLALALSKTTNADDIQRMFDTY